jgi:hypothetical protein
MSAGKLTQLAMKVNSLSMRHGPRFAGVVSCTEVR